MRQVFFTSDLHLGHVNVVKWRPFDSLEQMHATITDNWNRIVGPDDLVFILGDAVMGQRAETLPLVDALAGHKVLLPGNHDHVHPMHPERVVRRWVAPYAERFSLWTTDAIFWLADQWVDLCHFPRSGDHTEEERYLEWRPKDDGTWLLHGHVHGHQPTHLDRPRHIDVGVDAWDFAPVHADRLAEIITGRPRPRRFQYPITA